MATREVNAELETAPTSRIVIEQAKGMMAERNRIPVEEASTGSAVTPATATRASPTSLAIPSTATSTPPRLPPKALRRR